MWARMNGFCKELGFAHECAKGDFIPEPLFYRLGMKVNNTVADKFQNWLAFKTLRRNGKTAPCALVGIGAASLPLIRIALLSEGHPVTLLKS